MVLGDLSVKVYLEYMMLSLSGVILLKTGGDGGGGACGAGSGGVGVGAGVVGVGVV